MINWRVFFTYVNYLVTSEKLSSNFIALFHNDKNKNHMILISLSITLLSCQDVISCKQSWLNLGECESYNLI